MNVECSTIGDRSPGGLSIDPVSNRFDTRVIGVLQAGLVGTPYSLTEARVLYELAQRDTVEVADLRRELDLDAGYLSRILNRFTADGLATREQSSIDARRHVVRLTATGAAAFAVLDARQVEAVEQLLTPLSAEDRGRLVAAMTDVREVLGDIPRRRAPVLRAPAPGDLGWIVARHGRRRGSPRRR